MTNVDHLSRTNDHVRKYRRLHNQSVYAERVALPADPLHAFLTGVPMSATEAELRAGEVCGTAFCFGGWACLLAGWHQCLHDEDKVVDDLGRVETMADAGREALDLTAEQARILFDGFNDLELLDRYVALLVANPDAGGGELRAVRADYVRSLTC
jgi:hypothetical protein